jgi:hypothetical protein
MKAGDAAAAFKYVTDSSSKVRHNARSFANASGLPITQADVRALQEHLRARAGTPLPREKKLT